MKQYKYTICGKKYKVEVASIRGNKAEVEVNGVKYEVELESPAEPTPAKTRTVTPPPVKLSKPEVEHVAPIAQSETPKVSRGGVGTPVLSPLPGVIIKLLVKVGDQVKAGQIVAVLEAMKMENDIKADVAGTVSSVNVSEGESVPEGTTLLTIG